MTRDLRNYLQHPDVLFRRVRDQHGILRLSQAAKDYHPGQGVYRSSYKNARRLTATETNIAYHTADHDRWQKMDFVVGIEIKLSGNHTCLGKDGKPHPFYDICDELQGKYPKDFKFTGWHPHCRCFATPILKTWEEMAADDERILSGEEPTTESVNTVRDMPAKFKQWVEVNQERIDRAKSLPYFIKDNGRYFNIATQEKIRVLYPAATIITEPAPLTILQRAEARHAARTPEQVQAIQQAWAEREARLAEHIVENTTPQTEHPEILTDYDGEIKYNGYAIEEVMKATGCTFDKARDYIKAVRDFSYEWDWEIRQVQCGNLDIKLKKYHTLDDVRKKGNDIEEFITLSPKWKGAVTYRGMILSPLEVEDMREKLRNGEFHNFGTASWSTSEKVAKDYTNKKKNIISDVFGDEKTIRVVLVASKQTHATSIKHLSRYAEESEVAASKISRYRGLREERVNYFGTEFLYIFMEAI